MKRLIPTLLCVLMIVPLKAQNNSFQMEPESPSVIAKISLLSPKLIAEIAPSDYFTVNIGFWLKTSFWDYDEWQPSSRGFVTPSFRIEPRYFFNLEDRHEKGKRTRYYSGWYIGLPFDIEFPDFRYAVGGTIGFQCTMGHRWYWNISMGPGISYYDTRFHWTGAGEFALGIILNRM